MQNQPSTGSFAELIHTSYDIIGTLTPLKTDCGRLCGKICCKGDKAGMLLFPGEESLLGSVTGFHIENIEYMDNPEIKLLICEGTCTRSLRPLACRIFPCAPNIDSDSSITVTGDIRGRRMCPVWDLNRVSRDFIGAVQKVFGTLAGDQTMMSFMRLISDEQRMLRRFYGK